MMAEQIDNSEDIVKKIYNDFFEEFSGMENQDKFLQVATKDEIMKYFAEIFNYIIDNILKLKEHDDDSLCKQQIYLVLLIVTLENIKKIEYSEEIFEILIKTFTLDRFIELMKRFNFN